MPEPFASEPNARRTARSLAALAVLSLALGLVACGDARKAATGRPTGSASAEEPSPYTTTTTSVIPLGQALRGDGDADNSGDIDGNGDNDGPRVGGADKDSDSPTVASYRFPDADDKPTFAYGRPAGQAEHRTLGEIVRHYFAAAAAADGAQACSFYPPSVARSVPEAYGQGGPSYLRGGKTCPAVLSLLFAHFHAELAEPITIVATRVNGAGAVAIFSSRKLPASSIPLMRQGDSWKIEQPLGQPLP